jgi:hypothetical protein
MKKKKKLPAAIGIILIILVVAFTAIVVSSMGGGSGETSTPAPAAKATPASASAAPAESQAPEVSALASNDYITVTFEKLYEEPSIQGVVYLQLAMTNKWSKEIWVYLDKGSVNDEQLTSFLSGLPTYIMPGKTSRNPFIISYSQLSIESISEIQTVKFDVVVADRESLDEISRISGVQIQP